MPNYLPRMQKTTKQNFRPFHAAHFRVGIVVAEFNRPITHALLESAKKTLREYGVKTNNIQVIHVAGSVEIPVVAQAMAMTAQFDCLIAIGAIIRGETDHYDFVAKMVTEGILRVMLDYHLPIGFGVLTTNDLAQAKARAHVGSDAAIAALHSAHSMTHIKK